MMWRGKILQNTFWATALEHATKKIADNKQWNYSYIQANAKRCSEYNQCCNSIWLKSKVGNLGGQ